MFGGYPIRSHEGYPHPKTARPRLVWRSRLAGVLLVAILGQACIGHRREAYFGPPGSASGAGARLAAGDALTLTPPLRPVLEPLPSPNPNLRVWSLDAFSVGDNNQPGNRVTATYFESTANEPRPLVVVLPIWGSSTFPPRTIVRRLTQPRRRRDVHVLWIHGPDKLVDWQAAYRASSEAELEAEMKRWSESIYDTAIDIRRLVDWAHYHSAVAADRVALVGFSIGAIVGTIAAGSDPRIDVAVLVAGGANLEQIVASCRGRSAELRRVVKERFGWDAARLESWLEPLFAPVNPARFAVTMDPRRTLVVEAAKDKCMPLPSRETLWQSLGRPQRFQVSYGHKVSFLAMTPVGLHLISREIMNFLDRELSTSERRPSRLALERTGVP